MKSNAATCWVRLGGRCSERGIFGPGRRQPGSCAQANGKMRNLLWTGRRKLTLTTTKLTLTTTKPSRILGRGPLNCLSLSITKPLSYALGAEVRGVDATARLAAEQAATIRRAWLDLPTDHQD